MSVVFVHIVDDGLVDGEEMMVLRAWSVGDEKVASGNQLCVFFGTGLDGLSIRCTGKRG